MTFTFFELVSAMREQRMIKVIVDGVETTGKVDAISPAARTLRTWGVRIAILSETASYLNLIWPENNTGTVIFTFV